MNKDVSELIHVINQTNKIALEYLQADESVIKSLLGKKLYTTKEERTTLLTKKLPYKQIDFPLKYSEQKASVEIYPKKVAGLFYLTFKVAYNVGTHYKYEYFEYLIGTLDNKYQLLKELFLQNTIEGLKKEVNNPLTLDEFLQQRLEYVELQEKQRLLRANINSKLKMFLPKY